MNLDIGTYLKHRGKIRHLSRITIDGKIYRTHFPGAEEGVDLYFPGIYRGDAMGKEDGGAFDQNVIPELTEVAEIILVFPIQICWQECLSAFGSTWTMGGMFAQTSGLPLKIPIDGNAMSNQDLFMPAVTSIGDILAEQGYRQSLLIGSDAEFGGRKNYFEQHGNYEMLDYGWANANGKIPPDYRVWWGYEDQKLF